MDATFWAFIALLLFIALIVYLKVPGMIGRSLDERAENIKKELEEARTLREEAQQLLAEYHRKRKEAEKKLAISSLLQSAKQKLFSKMPSVRQKNMLFVATNLLSRRLQPLKPMQSMQSVLRLLIWLSPLLARSLLIRLMPRLRAACSRMRSVRLRPI